MRLSLIQRLFLSACIVLFVFLGATGIVLDKVASISLESIVREKLKIHTYALLAVADNENGSIMLPQNVTEKRFNTKGESLIAIVTDSQQQEHWRSVSAGDKNFVLPKPSEGEWLFGRAKSAAGELYFVSGYSTVWPDSTGGKSTFVFTIMERASNYKKVSYYRIIIVFALVSFGLVLLVLQVIIFRWGLKPVRGLTRDVALMNKRELQKLSGQYPRELQQLTSNVNILVDNERRQRERYRERMADLSHSLKTPLSVLRGIEDDIDNDGSPISRENILNTVQQQVVRMGNIVDYQLQRAVLGGHKSSFVATDVKDEVNSIINALNKVYVDKSVTIDKKIESNLSFVGDENDFTEILGNLLDNAYKHCKQCVKIVASLSTDSHKEKVLLIMIEDDGKGVPESKRTEILKRGVRLDSTTQGQGFGLAIVVEIIGSYNGHISIENSELGGALFTIQLPVK